VKLDLNFAIASGGLQSQNALVPDSAMAGQVNRCRNWVFVPQNGNSFFTPCGIARSNAAILSWFKFPVALAPHPEFVSILHFVSLSF